MNSEEAVLVHGLRLAEYSPNVLVCEETAEIHGFIFEGKLIWKITVEILIKDDFDYEDESKVDHNYHMNVTCTDTETMEFLVDDKYDPKDSCIVENWIHLVKKNYSDEIDDTFKDHETSSYTLYNGKDLHTAVWWAIHMTEDYNGKWFNVGGVKCHHNQDGTFSYENETEKMTSLIGKLLSV